MMSSSVRLGPQRTLNREMHRFASAVAAGVTIINYARFRHQAEFATEEPFVSIHQHIRKIEYIGRAERRAVLGLVPKDLGQLARLEDLISRTARPRCDNSVRGCGTSCQSLRAPQTWSR